LLWGTVPKRFYSYYCKPLPSKTPTLEPSFITGFTDAEGCFEIAIRKDSRCISRDRYNYNLCFSIGLNILDRAILESIQMYFNGIKKILGVAINPSFRAQLFSYAILGFALSGATILFSFIIELFSSFLLSIAPIVVYTNADLQKEY